MAGAVTVGIDIGTTSVKAVAADENGDILARARVPHKLLVPRPDQLEHDPNQAWRRGPKRALEAVGGPGAGVGLSAMVPSLTAVDRRGIARGPGLLYGDRRGYTGSTASPASSGEVREFLRWLHGEYPDAAGYWPAQACASFSLCGEAFVDFAVAASSSPLYDLATGWDQSVLDDVGVSADRLPRVEGGIGVAGGKIGDAVVTAGSVDGFCEQLVAGAAGDGDVMVLCGTTLMVWAVIPEWKEVDGIWTIPHVLGGKTLIGGASNAGGLFLDWVRRLVGRPRDAARPDHVPVWVPYARGERTPFHDPNRRAAVHDLDLTHGPAALRRGAYEAAGFVVRHHLELGGADAKRIVATGGGTRDPAWMQALADCTGLPVDVVAVPEGAALGAAFLARVAAGLESSVEDAARWATVSHQVEPDPAWVEPVAGRYRRFRELVDAGQTDRP